jgi:hypothetical protein
VIFWVVEVSLVRSAEGKLLLRDVVVWAEMVSNPKISLNVLWDIIIEKSPQTVARNPAYVTFQQGIG